MISSGPTVVAMVEDVEMRFYLPVSNADRTSFHTRSLITLRFFEAERVGNLILVTKQCLGISGTDSKMFTATDQAVHSL